MINVRNNGDYITIRTPYNAEFIAAIKALGCKWDGMQKLWIASTSKEAEVKALVVQHFGNAALEDKDPSEQTSTIMRYKDQVLSNVRSVLWNIKERGGMAPASFIERTVKEMQGQWAADVVNIALMAMGKKQRYEGKASDAQLQALIEDAKKDNDDLLCEITALRTAKEAK